MRGEGSAGRPRTKPAGSKRPPKGAPSSLRKDATTYATQALARKIHAGYVSSGAEGPKKTTPKKKPIFKTRAKK